MQYENSMIAHAKKISYEQERERLFKAGIYRAEAYDPFGTISYFREVCRHIGGLKPKEIKELIEILKKRNPEAIPTDINHAYCFDRDIMYDVLMLNPICKKVCEKNRYYCWNDFICRIDTAKYYWNRD